jgi:hypothetical protein
MVGSAAGACRADATVAAPAAAEFRESALPRRRMRMPALNVTYSRLRDRVGRLNIIT